VYLYDTATGEVRGRLAVDTIQALFTSLTFSPEGKRLAATTTNFHIQLWDVAEQKLRHVLKLRELDVPWMLAFSPDGKRLAGIFERQDELFERGGEVGLWDTTTGQEIVKDGDKLWGECLTFSPDGKTLALGTAHGNKVYLLDAATLEEKSALPMERDTLKGLTFSPDGRFLAGAHGGQGEQTGFPLEGTSGVLLWDVKEAKKPRSLTSAGVKARFAFSPDSKTLACPGLHADSEIRLWDVASGRQLLHRPGPPTPATALVGSPDGKLVASDARDGLRLWNAVTGESLHELGGSGEWRRACLFSPDGKQVIAVGSDKILQVWDVESGKERRRFPVEVPPGDCESVHVSADGKRLTAVLSHRGTAALLLVWDLATGKLLTQRPYKMEVRTRPDDEKRRTWSTAHAAFTPDGEVVSVWLGNKVGLAEVSSGRVLAELPRGAGRPLVFSPDGLLLAAALVQPKKDPDDGDDRKGIVLIEPATGEEALRLEIGAFECLAFTPDGRGLIVADREGLFVYDTGTGERLHRRAWPESLRDARGEVAVHSLAVLPGGQAATGLEEGEVLVWDLATASWPVTRPRSDLGREELDVLWSDLASEGRKGHHAVRLLTAVPDQALPLLRDRLRPTAAVDGNRVKRLLADLDDDKFAVREAAGRELAELRERIEPMLREALRGQLSPEARRRLETILDGLPLVPGDTRRALRALAVLERIDTAESRRLVEKLGGGADSRETRAAKAALERLNRR
jgi:WD40 repeat protein